MKCPKCHYLSFEPEPRCRNCGYDLALAAGDVELRAVGPASSHDESPLADLRMRPAEESEPSHAVTPGPIDLDRVVGHEPEDALALAAAAPSRLQSGEGRAPSSLRAVPSGPVARPSVRRAAGRRGLPAPSTTAELPLFVKSRPEPEIGAEEPLVKVPASPRQPLSVRRAQEVPRVRQAARREQVELRPLERDLLEDFKRLERRVAERVRESASPEAAGRSVRLRRLLAAGIDAALLGGIATGVLWATLRLCGLRFGDAATLPAVPFAAFVLLVSAGYLLMFTVAGGQTIGKMAAHIRVVDADGSRDGLSARQAAIRALLTVPSVLMLGAGFLPALAGQGLPLHDRFSHTRVIDA